MHEKMITPVKTKAFLFSSHSVWKERNSRHLTPDPVQEMEPKKISSYLKVFWFSKDDSTGYSEREKKKR